MSQGLYEYVLFIFLFFFYFTGLRTKEASNSEMPICAKQNDRNIPSAQAGLVKGSIGRHKMCSCPPRHECQENSG